MKKALCVGIDKYPGLSSDLFTARMSPRSDPAGDPGL